MIVCMRRAGWTVGPADLRGVVMERKDALMSGRDFGRGGRGGGFGDRDNRGGPPRDRDNRGGGFGDRDNRGGFGDRDNRGGGGGFRDRDAGPRREGAPSRPWERRDEERPARPSGDRPFERPAGPPPERDVRVERYNEAAEAPPREERPGRFGGDRPDRFADRPERPAGDRPNRFGNDRDDRRPMRDGAPAPAPRAPERPTPQATPTRAEEPKTVAEPKGAAAAAIRQTPQGWTQSHLTDSWNDEDKLKSWTPSNRDQQEMVEDNIEADPQIPGRDARAISVRAKSGVVTLTGTVRSRTVKFAASSDAFWTYGVNEVQNELVVESRMTRALTPAASAPTRETETEALEVGMTAPVTDATEALENAMTAPADDAVEAESDDVVADTATEVIASENIAATEAVQQDRLSVASESDYDDDDEDEDDEDDDEDDNEDDNEEEVSTAPESRA